MIKLLFFLAIVGVLCGLWRHFSRPEPEPLDFEQSNAVDKVLYHHFSGGEWETGTAWSEYGRRQSVALVRQGLGELLDETEVERLKPVWELGYELGQDGKSKATASLQRRLDTQKRIADSLRAENETLREQAARVPELMQGTRQAEQAREKTANLYRSIRAECEALREELEQLRQDEPRTNSEQKPPEEEPDTMPEDTESRNRRIVELRQAGQSLGQIAAVTGLSRQRVKQICDSVKLEEKAV